MSVTHTILSIRIPNNQYGMRNRPNLGSLQAKHTIFDSHLSGIEISIVSTGMVYLSKCFIHIVDILLPALFVH